VLTESPEALNMISENHIKTVISLLEKVGRDPKVLDVLSSLCEGNGVAFRNSQNIICNHLLPGKDLLLQTTMVDHVGRYFRKNIFHKTSSYYFFLKLQCHAEHHDRSGGG
jgi:hypothetical protein